MPRVESQVTRQALLVVGNAMVGTPEKLELFTEDGQPFDAGKDRTRARWRGTWELSPPAPYEQNDFVLDQDKLYILQDPAALDALSPTESDSGAWVLMTVGGGMEFFGEWAPGPYPDQAVVTHSDGLYVANEEIVVAPFEFVGGNWDDATGGTPQAPVVAVHTDAVLGDLMIWIGAKFGFGSYAKPNEMGWTKIAEQPLQSGAFPVGTLAVYGKAIEVADLGTTKTSVNTTDYEIAQLLVYRGATVPVEAEVDYILVEQNTSATPIAAAADPAETQPEDKVLRFWATAAQNFALDSGNNPSWGSGAGGQDKLLVDSHELIGIGSYWANPGAAALPAYLWPSGEHKYTGQGTIRLPSPSGFDPLKWTLIGILDAGSGLPPGGTIGQVVTKLSDVDGDADWEDSAGGGSGNTPEAWRDVGAGGQPAFSNGWASLDSGHKAQFRKYPDGTVEIRGLLDGGSFTNPAWTLPSDYWPVGQEIWFAVPTVSGPTWSPGVLLIGSDGRVVPMSGGDGWIACTCTYGTA